MNTEQIEEYLTSGDDDIVMIGYELLKATDLSGLEKTKVMENCGFKIKKRNKNNLLEKGTDSSWGIGENDKRFSRVINDVAKISRHSRSTSHNIIKDSLMHVSELEW